MNVTVSREEIDRTKVLLDSIREWEKLRNITGYQSRGKIIISKRVGMGGNEKEIEKKVSVDKYTVEYDDGRRSKDGLKMGKEIAEVATKHTEAMVEEIIQILKNHCPIPIEIEEETK